MDENNREKLKAWLAETHPLNYVLRKPKIYPTTSYFDHYNAHDLDLQIQDDEFLNHLKAHKPGTLVEEDEIQRCAIIQYRNNVNDWDNKKRDGHECDILIPNGTNHFHCHNLFVDMIEYSRKKNYTARDDFDLVKVNLMDGEMKEAFYDFMMLFS